MKAKITKNKHNPVCLPYEAIRAVEIEESDTFFSRLASVRVKGRRVKGFVTKDTDDNLEFTPEADPENCPNCGPGEGCKW